MAVSVLSPVTRNFLPTEPLPTSFRVNQGCVPQDQLGWLRVTPAGTPIEESRRRLQEDGYVFVKGVIPREDVLKMREHYFAQYEGSGLLKEGAPHIDGIYNDLEDTALHRGIGGGDTEGEDLKRLLAAHLTPDYLKFVAHPRLRAMVRDLMGWDEEVMLRRSMLRHNVPGGEGTGMHYDKLFLRGGPAFFLTAWVPIGDIIPTGGGLFYLKDSIELGQAIEDDFTERAKDFTDEEKISAFNRNMTSNGILANHPEEFEKDQDKIAKTLNAGDFRYKWLVANYEAGDVVFHHPCSIHSSCSNEDPEGRIRLSTDLRFYDKRDFDNDTADKRWMKNWSAGDGL